MLRRISTVKPVDSCFAASLCANLRAATHLHVCELWLRSTAVSAVQKDGLGPAPVAFTVKWASALLPAELETRAALFSEHYGVWESRGPRPGSRVQLSAARLQKDFLAVEETFAALAVTPSGSLVGHAIVRFFPFRGCTGAWILQIVVHREWRGRKVASQVLGAALATAIKLGGMRHCEFSSARNPGHGEGSWCSLRALGCC